MWPVSPKGEAAALPFAAWDVLGDEHPGGKQQTV